MKVLVLTPWPMGPLTHGGRVRTFRLASGLARAGASVEIACPWAPGQPRRAHDREGVRIVPQLLASAPLLSLPDHVLPSYLPVSWQAHLPRARALLRAATGFDVVHADGPGFAPWMERLPPGPARVYASPDVAADLARRFAGRVARLEQRAVTSSDLVVACTDQDARRFEELYGAEQTAVVPNGFDDGLLSLDRAGMRASARAELGLTDSERLVLFVGGSADHNLRAVSLLEERVLPRLGPSARLAVVGRAADALTGRDGRTLAREYVADIRPLLAAADVAVNPVPYGSGSNLKVAEYLAAGLPVVTTPIGARGFERWSDRMRIVELDDFPEAIEHVSAPASPAEGIEDLAWNRIAERLFARYARL